VKVIIMAARSAASRMRWWMWVADALVTTAIVVSAYYFIR
jgi:hypothetical protein